MDEPPAAPGHIHVSPSHEGGGSHGAMGSEHHADAGVLEAHGQDAFVDLVELHKLQEVNEECQAVVYGEVLPASVFALQRRDEEGENPKKKRRTFSLPGKRAGTHRDHQVVFDLQLMTQRQDEALSVLLALTDQEHAATHTRVIATDNARGYSQPPDGNN